MFKIKLLPKVVIVISFLIITTPLGLCQSIGDFITFQERQYLDNKLIKIDTESLTSRINLKSNIVIKFDKEKLEKVLNFPAPPTIEKYLTQLGSDTELMGLREQIRNLIYQKKNAKDDTETKKLSDEITEKKREINKIGSKKVSTMGYNEIDFVFTITSFKVIKGSKSPVEVLNYSRPYITNEGETKTAPYVKRFSAESFKYDEQKDTFTAPEKTDELINAEVILNNGDIEKGDIILIEIQNLIDGKRTERFIKKFEVVKLGWNPSISTSFLFIKRVWEPDGSIEKTNFKPAPGSTLLFVWKTRNNKFLDCIDFGCGVNVSYLDFDPAKEFELGLSALFSIFSTTLFPIQFGYGTNLHADVCKDYYFIGIGFLSVQF